MADNHDAAGPKDPGAGPHQEGDFPLDFFEEETGPVSLPESELEPGAPLAHGPAFTPTPEAHTPAAPEAFTPVASEPPIRKPAPPPPPAPPAARKTPPAFPIAIAALLLALFAVAWVLNQKREASATSSPSAEPPAKESTVTALASTVDAQKKEVGDLSKRLGDLQKKVDELPETEEGSDLKPLLEKVDGLAKKVDAVAPLPEKVDALDARVGELDKALKSLKDGMASLNDQVAGLKDEVKKSGEAVAAAEKDKPATTQPADVNVEGQAMSQAVELFKAGKYKEAGEVFKTVEDNDPKDARVWYYAALSRGLATGDWKGETIQLVKKGVEREKAGTPGKSEIDAEFAKIPTSVKPWFDFYRKTAR